MIRVLAVCAGRCAPLVVAGRGASEAVASAIVKSPVSTVGAATAIEIGPLGVAGDEQADPSVHGGLDKAVYVYPREHYAFWQTVRAQAGHGEPLAPGAMGENLLIEGLLETDAWVGDRLTIGEVELRIESPRAPCFKFNARMGFAWATKMMVQSGYTGFYCSVVRQGKLAAGDSVLVRPGDRVVSIEQAHRMKHRSRRS
jgi:MOSC domain-containing protein YiiM